MPKFRNFHRTSPEISTFFSLFSYSVSWQGRRGPFPWLEDCECKRARPPSLISGPWGPLFPLVVVFSARDNFNDFTSVHITCFFLFSGSALRALLSWEVEPTKFFEMQSMRFTSALRGYEAQKRMCWKLLNSWEVMLWGKPHRTCPLKIFEKNYKFKKWKILIFDFCGKNRSDRPNFIPGGVGNGF